VFGNGFILPGVELPEVLETVDKSPVEVAALDEFLVEEASLEEMQED
jgi:hypothetical protein